MIPISKSIPPMDPATAPASVAVDVDEDFEAGEAVVDPDDVLLGLGFVV